MKLLNKIFNAIWKKKEYVLNTVSPYRHDEKTKEYSLEEREGEEIFAYEWNDKSENRFKPRRYMTKSQAHELNARIGGYWERVL